MSERVAIVTGGASGIGKAVAEALADSGDQVVVVADLNEAAGKEFADTIGGLFRESESFSTGRLQTPCGRDIGSLRRVPTF